VETENTAARAAAATTLIVLIFDLPKAVTCGLSIHPSARMAKHAQRGATLISGSLSPTRKRTGLLTELHRPRALRSVRNSRQSAALSMPHHAVARTLKRAVIGLSRVLVSHSATAPPTPDSECETGI